MPGLSVRTSIRGGMRVCVCVCVSVSICVSVHSNRSQCHTKAPEGDMSKNDSSLHSEASQFTPFLLH